MHIHRPSPNGHAPADRQPAWAAPADGRADGAGEAELRAALDRADQLARRYLLQRDGLVERLSAVTAERNAAEETVRELLRMVACLQLRERRALEDIRRLGRTSPILRSRTLARWRRSLDKRIGRLKGRLAAARQVGPEVAAPPSAIDPLSAAAPEGLLILRSAWQQVVLMTGPADWEVWARPLAAGGRIGIELDLPASHCPAEERAVRQLELTTNEPVCLIAGRGAGTDTVAGGASPAGSVAFALRRCAGTPPGLLQLELRLAGAGEAPGIPTGWRRAGLFGRAAGEGQAAHAVWRADAMIRDGRVAEGLAYAEAHATPIERPAIAILRANLVRADDAAWLAHLNEYVATFGIAPITLEPDGPTRFHRLATVPVPPVETGPLVSVIMPAFNAERTLAKAARSILDQSWRPIELIIIDDASEDGTWAVACDLAAADARVRLLRNPVNVGPYVSKNVALQIARGHYLTGHDADDWAHPQRIERHVAAMRAEAGRVVASTTRMLRMTEAGAFSSIARISRVCDDGVLRDASISCLVETETLRTVFGGWDCVRFGADSELIGRLARVLGDGFRNYRQLGMLCLDLPESLTNDPLHGISKLLGVSETRRAYRAQWEHWQEGVDPGTARLDFPPRERLFAAPAVALVPPEAIQAALDAAIAQQGPAARACVAERA